MLLSAKSITLALTMGISTLALSGCSGSFRTDYSTQAPADAKADWRVARVNVTVPAALVSTEENSFVPRADIVWHGDPAGDRKAQVAAVVKAGVERGFAGLKGRERVLASVTLRRFHALTPMAYQRAPAGTGVHSVEFDLVISDARTGEILSGPTAFSADLPAYVAADFNPADGRSVGDIWKAQIESHIAETIRSWLGTGPDIRGKFSRMGA